MGEKLYKNSTSSSLIPPALRYMYQPSLDGSSADCWYSGLKNLDVHLSSGVANHFFYLLAEGSTLSSPTPSKTCQTTDTKTATGSGELFGIGRIKAAQIWYRALTVYMVSSTNYSAARQATLKAVTDLVALDSTNYSSSDIDAVARAWTAVLVK